MTSAIPARPAKPTNSPDNMPGVETRSTPDKKITKQYSDRVKAERKLGWLLAGPAFVIMLLVTLYPILQAMYESLFQFRLTAPEEREFIGLGNYAVILTDPVWWRDLGTTLFITVVTVAVELVLGFALALVMHKALKSVRGLLRTAILVPYGIITVVSAFASGSTPSTSTPATSTAGSLGSQELMRTPTGSHRPARPSS